MTFPSRFPFRRTSRLGLCAVALLAITAAAAAPGASTAAPVQGAAAGESERSRPAQTARPSGSQDASGAALLRQDVYRLEMAGTPAGAVVERRRVEGDLLVTETELEMRVRRGETPVTLEMASRFVETRDGEPVSMWARQGMGRIPLEVTYTFHPDHLEVMSRQGESVSRRRASLPQGEWLTPARVDALVAAKVTAGADRFTYQTLDPLLGAIPVEVVAERTAPAAPLELPAGNVTASRWRQRQLGASPVESVIYLDAGGRLVKSRTTMLGVETTLALSAAEAVAAELAAGEVPELMVRTFVTPDRPVPAPRRSRRAVYRLQLEEGELPSLPQAGGQRVEREGGAARVVVTAGAPSRGAGAARDADAAEPAEVASGPYLAASAYLNHRDPVIAALARRALEGVGEGTAERAEALRAFVHRHLERKDLGTGFATATEVAVLQAGDCTEHSVLLAALLRSAGIPSRLVGGLLYVEEFAGERHIFGYHMWVQARVEGRWRDYDALTARPFDAAHIALVTSAMGDGDGFTAAGATLARVMGGLSIQVLEVEH